MLFESLSSEFPHTYAQDNFSKVLKIENNLRNLEICLGGFQLYTGDGSKPCLTFSCYLLLFLISALTEDLIDIQTLVKKKKNIVNQVSQKKRKEKS